MSTQLLHQFPPYASSDGEDLAPSKAARSRLLRLSVTDLCNFRCRYCMPMEGVHKAAQSQLLSWEELAKLVAWLAQHAAVNRVRLTGGEPLVRPGIEHLIAQATALPGIQEISLTTNGAFLSKMAWSLKAAGLSRVNISLDSMDESRFAEITRGGNLERTLAGIKTAQEAGLTPVKLNAVLLRSTWKQEVPRLLDYAAGAGLEIRFIELMRTGTERAWCASEFVSVDEVSRGLGAGVVAEEIQNASPARRTTINWQGALVRVGWISPRSNPFCGQCERLRLDARGQLRRCLMDAATFDLRGALRSPHSQTALPLFQAYMDEKTPPHAMDSAFAMSQIGG